MLSSDADVQAKDSRGDTPLHGAAERGSPDSVRVLLEACADVQAKDAEDNTPLEALEGSLANYPHQHFVGDERFDNFLEEREEKYASCVRLLIVIQVHLKVVRRQLF